MPGYPDLRWKQVYMHVMPEQHELNKPFLRTDAHGNPTVIPGKPPSAANLPVFAIIYVQPE